MTDGIVLAGGRSTRFEGVDKAFATIEGKPLLWHVLDGVTHVVDRVVVSCRRSQTDDVRSVLDASHVDGRIATDARQIGPLGGLDDGLSVCESEWTVVVACDLPLVDRRLFEALAPRPAVDAVVPRINGEMEPLCARYRTQRTHDVVQSAIESETYRVKALPEALSTAFVDADSRPFDVRYRLQNVNTRSDLEQIRCSIESSHGPTPRPKR